MNLSVYFQLPVEINEFHDKHHPKEMGKAEIEAFVIYLAVKGYVSASTQNQVLSGWSDRMIR